VTDKATDKTDGQKQLLLIESDKSSLAGRLRKLTILNYQLKHFDRAESGHFFFVNERQRPPRMECLGAHMIGRFPFFPDPDCAIQSGVIER